MQNHFSVQLFHTIFRVNFFCVCVVLGIDLRVSQELYCEATRAAVRLAQSVVSICCPWHWESKFHVQLKTNFMLEIPHNFLSCISISLSILPCSAQYHVNICFDFHVFPHKLNDPIFSPSHVSFQWTTLSQCRDFQKPLQFQDILADPRAKDAHTEVNSHWNVYTEIEDREESILMSFVRGEHCLPSAASGLWLGMMGSKSS